MTAVQPTARHAAVLDELVALVLAEGFSAFTLDELAHRLRCSKSTMYALAPSKEQLVTRAVAHFFRIATERIETRTARAADPLARVGAYLAAVGDELRPASPVFFADLAAFPAAGDIYARNTRWAADRVQQLIREGVRAKAIRRVDAAFAGAAVAQLMAAIHRGDIAEATGLDDARAYRALSDLLLAGLAPVTASGAN